MILREHTDSRSKWRIFALLIVFGCLAPLPAVLAGDDDLTTSQVRRYLRRAKVDSKLIDDFLTRYRNGLADESDMRLLAKREKQRRREKSKRRRSSPLPAIVETTPVDTTPAPADPVSTGITRTWDGGGANPNWMTDDNWDTRAPDPGDALAFGGSTQLTNTNNFAGGDAFYYGLTFNNTAGAFTLNGAGIELAGGYCISTG